MFQYLIVEGLIMNKDEILKYEGLPVRLILKNGSGEFYGTYIIISNSDTVVLTDRFRNDIPIDFEMIGLIQRVNSIKYIDGVNSE